MSGDFFPKDNLLFIMGNSYYFKLQFTLFLYCIDFINYKCKINFHIDRLYLLLILMSPL